MTTEIKLKRSAVPGKVPTTAQLELGEIALNTNDGKIFIKRDDGNESIVEIGASSIINTVNDTSATVHYPVFVSNTGNQTAKIRNTSTALSYVPSTGTLTATTFSGNLSGNADTAAKLQDQWSNVTGNMTGFVNDGGGNIGIRFNATPGGTNTLVEDGIAFEIEVSNDSNTGNFTINQGSTPTGTAGETVSWTAAFTIDSSESQLLSYGNRIFDDSYHPTADTWTTARNLTIGNTVKSVNGSADVAWSLSEIGALPLTGGTLSGDLNFSNNALISYNAGPTNIDHIWHDDGTNTWHFVSDGTYKTTGNSILRGSRFQGSADSLTTPRAINGVNFDGSAAISVPSLQGTNSTTTLVTTGVTSGVNYLTTTNSATGDAVEISTAGSDTNIGLTITTKGTGAIIVDTGAGGGQIDLKSGSSNVRIWDDNSNHYYQIVTGDRTSNYDITLPNGSVMLSAGTMATTDTTQTISSQKTFSATTRFTASTQMHLKNGSTDTPTTIIRNDGNFLYVLLSNASTDVNPSWNSLRPLYINATDGRLHSVNGQTFSGGLSTDSQITSTLTTGTAPFIVASETLVANLNAELLDGIQSSGFLRSDTADSIDGNLTVNAGSINAYQDSNVPSTKIRFGRNNTQYFTFHGDATSNILTAVSPETNPKTSLRFAYSVDGGSSLASIYTLNGSSGTIWHTGNDGVGSGLDADLFDGLQSSQFLRSDAVDVLTITDTNPDAAVTPFTIDFNMSGSTALTSNRTKHAILIDLDHISTSGTTTDGQRETLYGVTADIDTSGTAYIVRGFNGTVRANNTTGTIDTISGVRGLAEGDSGIGGTTTNVIGVEGTAIHGGDGTTTNVYGGTFRVLKETTSTSTLPTAIGIRAEVEIDANTITNAYGAQHIIDIDGGTLTNSYLTYGAYEGTPQAGSWSAYYPSAAPSYFANEVRIGSTTDSGNFALQVAGNSYVSGNVGIGTTSPSTRLHVDGEVTAVDFNTTSDAKVKNNVEPIIDAISKISQINGVTFSFINDPKSKRHAGVIAQDVERVLPEAVNDGNDGIKTVAYGNMIALLVEAIKEQQKQIEELKLLVNK